MRNNDIVFSSTSPSIMTTMMMMNTALSVLGLYSLISTVLLVVFGTLILVDSYPFRIREHISHNRSAIGVGVFMAAILYGVISVGSISFVMVSRGKQLVSSVKEKRLRRQQQQQQ